GPASRKCPRLPRVRAGLGFARCNRAAGRCVGTCTIGKHKGPPRSFPISASFLTSPVLSLDAALPNPLTDTGLSRDAYGTEAQWTLATDLAELSQDVYGGAGSGPIGDGEWTPVDQATLSEVGIQPEGLVAPDTGFQAAV